MPVLEWLADRIIEHPHNTVLDLLIKAHKSDITLWPAPGYITFWTDRVTAHTILQAMVKIFIATGILPTTELSISRTRQLTESENPLSIVRGLISRSLSMSTASFEPRVTHAIRFHDLQPHLLVFTLSKNKEPECKPHCLPRVVVSRSLQNWCHLDKAEGIVSSSHDRSSTLSRTLCDCRRVLEFMLLQNLDGAAPAEEDRLGTVDI